MYNQSLANIFKECKTDKFHHGYYNVYDRFFSPLKFNELKLLEIGVREGYSHLAWQKYFPNGKIYGIENFASPVFGKKNHKYFLENIEIFIGDQEDVSFLQNLPIKEYDIIIDDGGHRMSQQQISLGFLIKYLKPGGFYVIEDLHTSKMKQYWDDDDHKKTTLYVLKNLVKSPYVCNDDWEYLKSRIDSINFFENDKVCVLKSK